jgi:hypothetical protein
MAVIKVSLDKRKIKKDNTYPICLRIHYGGKSTIRSTKIDVSDNYWDDTKKAIKKSHPNASILNKLLQKQLVDLQSELLLPPAPKPTSYSFANELIQELKTDNLIGNAWVYESTVNALKGFHPDEQLYFDYNLTYKGDASGNLTSVKMNASSGSSDSDISEYKFTYECK